MFKYSADVPGLPLANGAKSLLPTILGRSKGVAGTLQRFATNTIKNQIGAGKGGNLEGVKLLTHNASPTNPAINAVPGLIKKLKDLPLLPDKGKDILGKGVKAVTDAKKVLPSNVIDKAIQKVDQSGPIGHTVGYGLKATKNTLTTNPVGSLLKAVHPRLGKLTKPITTGAAGTYVGNKIDTGLRKLPDAVDEVLREEGVKDPQVLKEQYNNLYWLQPKLLYKSLAPGWAGGDETPVNSLLHNYVRRAVTSPGEPLANYMDITDEIGSAKNIPKALVKNPSVLVKNPNIPVKLIEAGINRASDSVNRDGDVIFHEALADNAKDFEKWFKDKHKLTDSPLVDSAVSAIHPGLYNQDELRRYINEEITRYPDVGRIRKDLRNMLKSKMDKKPLSQDTIKMRGDLNSTFPYINKSTASPETLAYWDEFYRRRALWKEQLKIRQARIDAANQKIYDDVGSHYHDTLRSELHGGRNYTQQLAERMHRNYLMGLLGNKFDDKVNTKLDEGEKYINDAIDNKIKDKLRIQPLARDK